MREIPAAAGQTTLHWLSSPAAQPESRIVQLSVSFGEPVPAEKLRQTWSGLATRYGVLRSAFRSNKIGGLIQAENDAAEASWRQLDWSEVPVSELGSRWAETLAEEAALPIDLATAPAIRFLTIRLPDGSNHLLATHPRFLLDEDSWFLLLCEWIEALDGQPAPELIGEPAPEPSASTEFWKTYLEGASSKPLRIYPEGQGSANGHSILMDRETTRAIADAFGKAGSNSRDGILALWSYLLARLSLKTEALTLTSLDIPRSAPGAQRNLLPCRLAIMPDLPLKDWLRSFSASEKRRTAAANIGFPGLPEPFAGLGLSDFVSLFTWLPPSIADRITEAFPRWIKMDAKLLSQPLHPLELEIRDGPRLHLHLSSRLPAAETPLLLSRLESLIHQVLNNQDLPLGELEISGTAKPEVPLSSISDDPKPVQDAIAEVAKETPDAVAIEDASGAILSFREVHDYALLVAAYLQKENLGQGWTVACCLTPSPWIPVALLGVLHAGDTCLPLDPGSDSGWLASQVEGGDAELIICDSGTEHHFTDAGKKLLVIDQEWSTIAAGSVSETPPKAPKVAVIITGGPRWTSPGQQTLSPSLLALATKRSSKLLDLQPGDRVLVTGPSGSAAFLESLLCSLQSGATALIGRDISNGLQETDQPTHLRLMSTGFASFVAHPTSPETTLRHLIIDAQPGPVRLVDVQAWQERQLPKIRCHHFLSPCGFSGLGLVCEIKEAGDFPQAGGFVSQGRPSRFSGATFEDRFGRVPPTGYPGLLRFSLPFTTAESKDLEAWQDDAGNFFVIPPVVIPEPQAVEPPIPTRPSPASAPPPEPPPESPSANQTSEPATNAAELSQPPLDQQPRPALLTNLGGPLEAPLLVLLHDLNGTTTSYAQILPYLIQDWFVLGSIPPLGKPRDVIADAARLISALGENWPNTSIHLLGIGYGGLPAFEMATRLRNAGEDVPFIVTAGTPPPVPEKAGWLKSLKRSLSGTQSKASEPNSLENFVASYQPKPLEGPFGVILTSDLPHHAEKSWQELAPDAVIEFLDCNATEMLTTRAADFAKALRSLAGLV
jgi:pimeloyl-ACP methyl ester carboxylesterase